MTCSGTTPALPSHPSSRLQYEQPLANAISVVCPISFGALIGRNPRGVMSTSSSTNAGSVSRSSARERLRDERRFDLTADDLRNQNVSNG